MFNAPSEDFYLYKFDQIKRTLVNEVKSYYNIPREGVAIVFDTQNYNNRVYPAWGVYAQHFDIEYGGVEEMSPEHLLKIMESRKFRYLIWLSQKVCSSSNIEFSWILAHELTHLKQSILNPELLRIEWFLSVALWNIEIPKPKIYCIIPTELDAQLSAWRTINKIFSQEHIDDFFREMMTPNREPESYKYLLRFNPNNHYDVIQSTIKFIQTYKNELNGFISNSDDIHISNFNIDKSINLLLS